MAKIAKNELKLEPLPEGGFRLYGNIDGEKVRRKSPDLSVLEALKAKLETDFRVKQHAQASAERTVATWMTPEQIRDAEAAFLELGKRNRTLVECVRAADSVLGDGEQKNAVDALNEWIAFQEKRKRRDRTLNDNENRTKAFLKHCGVVFTDKSASVFFLNEITNAQIESYVYGSDIAPGTQVGRARVIQAFMNFCVKRKYLRASPFDVDTSELAETAKRARARPIILSGDQAERLFRAVEAVDSRFIPYIVLSTWCFMRHAEVTRTLKEQIHFTASSAEIEVWPVKAGTVSYRTVSVPANMVEPLRKAVEKTEDGSAVFYNKYNWDLIREKAGLLKRTAPTATGARTITFSIWQENILRHTGISYLHKKTGDIKAVTRQAGNSEEVAFAHYLKLAKAEEMEKFYSVAGSVPQALALVAS